jgi:hypothetical protein
MPQTWKKPPQMLPWQHRYVAIFKCSPKEEKKATEIVVANEDEIKQNSDLHRVLRVLQFGMLSKRDYPNAISPTIRYLNFRRPGSGHVNQAQRLLNDLLQAQTKEEVQQCTSDLATRYVNIKNVQKGVLIFLVSPLKLETKAAENCVFVFKCDFEDISQVTPKKVFRKVEDAFEEQAKKGAQYPYFNGRKFDRATIRIFDALGQTQYWLEFLESGERPSDSVTLQSALISTLGITHRELLEKYSESLRAPEKSRPLATEDQLIKPGDRLTSAGLKQVINALPANLAERKITFTIDKEQVSLHLKEYGRTWMVAKQDGTYYLLLKGAELRIYGKEPTPFDLADIVDLQEAAKELDAPLG